MASEKETLVYGSDGDMRGVMKPRRGKTPDPRFTGCRPLLALPYPCGRGDHMGDFDGFCEWPIRLNLCFVPDNPSDEHLSSVYWEVELLEVVKYSLSGYIYENFDDVRALATNFRRLATEIDEIAAKLEAGTLAVEPEAA